MVTPIRSPEYLRLLDAMDRRSATYPRLQFNWVENLEYVTRELATKREQAGWASFGLFWIRLHGVIQELKGRFDRYAAMPVATYRTSPLAHAQDIHRLILELRDTLTEDEVIWADYRRHTEAHVVQDGYELAGKVVKGETKITKSTFKVKSLGKTYDVDDLDQRLKGVLRRYSSERALAIDFATRLHPPTVALYEAFQRFSSPTR